MLRHRFGFGLFVVLISEGLSQEVENLVYWKSRRGGSLVVGEFLDVCMTQFLFSWMSFILG